MSTTYDTLIRNGVNYSHDTAESISCTSGNNLQEDLDSLASRSVPLGGTSTQFLRGDGTWNVPPDTTYGVVTTADNGLAPSGGTATKYLRGDGTWAVPTDHTYAVMTSGTSGVAPQSTANMFLKGNATWASPDTTYHVVDSVGNGLVPSGGTNAKYLRADGSWQTPTNHTYAVMTSGKTGLAPSGGSTATTGMYLRGDAKWDAPDDTTYGLVTTAGSGLVRKLTDETDKFLRGDGTWKAPTDHTYGYMSTGSPGLAHMAEMNYYLGGDNVWRPISYTDVNLRQVNTTSDVDYRVLLSYNASNTTETENVRKTPRFLVNPGSGITYLYNGTSYFTAQEKLVRLYLNGWIYHNSTQNTVIQSASQGSEVTYYGVDLGVADSTWVFRGHADNRMKCGDGNLRWKVVYAKTGTINTSDRNQKQDIYDLDEDFCENFIMDLKPVSYKFKNKPGTNHDRTHYGFIAQDVEETMTKLGLTALDFGGFCKDQKMEYHYEEPELNPDGTYEEGPDGKPLRNMNLYPVEGEYIYGLRYDEFLAPIIKTIQHRQKILDSLDEEIELLEARITALETA